MVGRYREVAVVTSSFLRRFRVCGPSSAVAAIVGSVFLTCALTGCSEVLTYNDDSRRKGLADYKEGNYNDAVGSFQTAVKYDPRDYRSYYYLGAAYDRLGSHQQAIQSYRSALRVMKVSHAGREDKKLRSDILDGLAQSLARSGQANTAVALPEDNLTAAERQWLAGKVNRYGGDADAAIEGYQQARMLDPDNFYLNKDFGLYMEQLGQRELASPPLRRANALDATDEEVAAALRRIAVVPGPGLKEKNELVRPPVPKGPIPEWDPFKGRPAGAGDGGTAAQSPPAPPPQFPEEDPSVPLDTFSPAEGDSTAAQGPRD
jgi:tetratricopeptide (TPR) repeat protein